MEFSRRGFLGTLITAAVGMAATFDSQSKLWLPNTSLAEVPRVLDEQLELNDAALKFAKMMADRLADHRVMVMRNITFEAGSKLTDGVLNLDGIGRGVFRQGRRYMKAAPIRNGFDLDHLAGELRYELRSGNDRAVAPISPLGKRTEPWVDTLVAVGTDLETGLSARLMKYQQDDEPMLMADVAIGQWFPADIIGPQRWRWDKFGNPVKT